jgi:hypothetical protein
MRIQICAYCLACALVAGCSSGSSSSQGATQNPISSYPPAVSLADTIFLGDEITLNWTYPASGTLYGIARGEFQDFSTNYGIICGTGCSPTGFQFILKNQPSFTRVVILIGTFDALQTTACGGSGFDPGSVSVDYDDIVQTARTLGLQVFVGTIPPIYSTFGTAACNAQVAILNGQIEAMAQRTGAYVVDYNSALSSATDFVATGTNTGIVPSATGYAIMQSTYASVN